MERWRVIRGWLWALAPLWTFGWGTAAVHTIAAARKHSRKQALTLPPYFAALAAMLVYMGGSSADQRIFGIAMGFNMLVGVGHSLAIREWVESDSAPSLQAAQRKALDSYDDERAARRRARQIATDDPQRAHDLQIGRADLPDRAFPDGDLVDVNHVPEASLVTALALPADEVHRVVAARDQVGGFSSYEDMLVTSEADPETWDGVAERLLFLPVG